MANVPGVKDSGCRDTCQHEKNKPHYIAMGGVHGCLPSHCEVYETWQEAVTALVDQYELGKKRARVLARDKALELNNKRDGNEYVEIVECDCGMPMVHSDFKALTRYFN